MRIGVARIEPQGLRQVLCASLQLALRDEAFRQTVVGVGKVRDDSSALRKCSTASSY